METANGWVQLIAVVLGGGVATAIVQVIATRKKTGAETDSTFVATANDQRQSLVLDADRYRAERDTEHERANKLDWKVRRWWERADRFMIWARRQEARNIERGIEDPMPSLYPPDGE